MSSLTLKTRHRHSGLEGCIIKATSHNDSCMDYKSVERVFAYVKTSPSQLIIFLWALTRRIERTRNWVVALKSLILFHGVLSSKAPGTRKIGRLPFNLSCFEDGYVTVSDRLAFDLFVQAYFVFVDLKSVTLLAELNDDMVVQMEEEKEGVKRELVRVQRWQKLMGVSLNVKPCGVIRDKVLVIEAMDCMIIEVLELYSKINQEIDEVLDRIYKNKVGKGEVLMVIDVLHKANKQGDDLCDYFEFCRKVGLIRAPVCVEIQRFSKDDFLRLEKIMNGNEVCTSMSQIDYEKERKDVEYNKTSLKTVITDKWKVFDEDFKEVEDGGGGVHMVVEEKEDPFAPYCSSLNLSLSSSSGLPQANHLNPFIDYYADRPFQQEQVQMLSLI